MKITGVRPWLIKSERVVLGEFLFVEVTTDEGVSGWGEITTTTKLANRALCAMLRQIGAAIAGEDPAQIELLWHKIFRSFTYMGSRGAAVECVSAIDIALWDIRGKVARQADLRAARRRRSATRSRSTPTPTSASSPARRPWSPRSAAIVDSGHTALKFDPFPYQGAKGATAARASRARAISTGR